VLVNRTGAIIALLLLDLKSKMIPPDDHHPFPSNNRWYDKDPALARALEQLRHAPDNYQAQVALNIIKIIVEHQMEEGASEHDPSQPSTTARNWDDEQTHRRWYDVHETLSSAIQLLADSPPDLQQRLIPSIAQMIEATLNRSD
jgi:hypothetical protein